MNSHCSPLIYECFADENISQLVTELECFDFMFKAEEEVMSEGEEGKDAWSEDEVLSKVRQEPIPEPSTDRTMKQQQQQEDAKRDAA